MAKSPKELAIEKDTGPCIIMAGAGTGKTYTLLKKIKHLIETGKYEPKDILCLTFSNEATNDLKNRLSEEIKESSEVTVRTFHAFFSDIIKEYGHLIDVSAEFEILLPDDAKVMLNKYFEITPYWANRYIGTISTARAFGISLMEIKDYAKEFKKKFDVKKDLDEHAEKLDFEFKTLHLNPSDTKEDRKETKERKKEIKNFLKEYKTYKSYEDFIVAWENYDKIKKDKNLLDFSDLTHYALDLFRKFDLEKVQNQFKYVFIDEFQDTNKLQFELINYLAKKHKNITIVGDPNQSIYGFRGAYKDSFEHFEESFNVTEKDRFLLNKSYRSPNTVLRIAHKLIKNNWDNPKECPLIENAENKEGNPVKNYKLINKDEESRKIAELVEERIEKGIPLKEICVLFRTHQQGNTIQQAFEAKGIPIVSAGTTDLMSKREIRTVVSFLSMLNNLRERTGTGEQAWWNLFHYNNELGPDDTLKIGRYLKSKRNDGISIDESILTSLDKLQLSKEGEKIVGRVIKKLKELSKNSNLSLPNLVLEVYRLSGLNRAFSYERTVENVEAMMNLKAFHDIVVNYAKFHGGDLSSFINYLEIVAKMGVDIPASSIQDINAVRLMTIHATKGLQFDTVIVSNLAENRFPITRTRNEPLIPKELLPDQKEILDGLKEGEDPDEAIKEYEKMTLLIEERRLCYVAFTRAKKELILTFAGTYNDVPDSATPSTFLKEIDFEDNEDIKLIEEKDEKSMVLAPSSKYEQLKSDMKRQFIESLDCEDIDDLFSRLAYYVSLRDGKIDDFKKAIAKVKLDKKYMEDNIKKHKEQISCMKMDRKNFTFSPTALIDYDECPKRYELSKLYQMPSVSDFEWTGASSGSFVHKVLEDGVREGFDSLKQFEDLSKEMAKLPEWQGVDLKDVKQLLGIFWARNKGVYDKNSLVEEKLPMNLGGYRFFGLADRIDILKDGVSIVDYKTNKQALSPKKRAWQLGYYALAAESKEMKPKKLVLEMLRLEKPVVMVIEGDEVKSEGSKAKSFKLSEVKKELIETAKKIEKNYEKEFKVSEDDGPCMWCGYKFYCPKWKEK